MRDSLIKRYHQLPPLLRSVAATARGGYLRLWRYGPRTEILRDEALTRDTWSRDEWEKWRSERLAFVLHRAATRVPHYRALWEERRRRGDRASWEYLENWPLLEKEVLRGNPAAFVADDRSPSGMFHDHTSGTSGKSLDLWLARDTVQRWYALFEARCRYWNGVSRHDRWAIMGGQLVASVEQVNPPFWVWNAALHQLYLSAYHLSPRTAKSYLDALRRYEVRYIVTYPSAIHSLAREVLVQHLEPPQLKFILANAEPVLEHQRRDIEEAFQCPVRETYGMAEIVAGASECGHGQMHLWPELGLPEIMGGDRADNPGELICTGLLNADMPLIRYRVGDRGWMNFSNTLCGCGRSLPILSVIEGRVDDVLYTADGRSIGRLDPIFKSRLPIKEAQIVQESLTVVRVYVVPAEGFTRADGTSLVDRIRDRMGAVEVFVEEVESIPRTSNGKFRAVVCRLSAEQKMLAQART